MRRTLHFLSIAPSQYIQQDSNPSDVQEIDRISVEFGQKFEIIEIFDETTLVKDHNNNIIRFRNSDIVSQAIDVLVKHGPAYEIEQRARLLFWDSQIRAEGFLTNGPTPETLPILRR